ncbi:hypothetical protein Ancab_010955 [Ancistrocladus abbreviatus]
MEACCNLEVDVNGEGVFMVDKEVLSSYSGRLSKLFSKTSTKGNLKVIFHDFPGGVESFELITRFSYNNGGIEINPSNISILHCAAHFMEMNKSFSGNDNLVERTEKILEELNCWTWFDLLGALKQSQDLASTANRADLLQKLLDALVGRLALANEASPCPSISSPDSFGFRVSCDSRSTESLKTGSSRATWWFEDLVAMNHDVIEMIVKLMVCKRFDHVLISRFLFYYQKAKFVHAKYDDKCKIMEMIINLLHSLGHSSVPNKSLFAILRVALNLSINKCSQNRLEGMIGGRLDEVTLDNLLVPSPSGVNYFYDINLILRFLKSFTSRGPQKISPDRVRKVANLIDSYLAEVAPDPSLKPLKFITLSMALPDSARESFDDVYHAIDIYLEVHVGLSEEEKLNICCVLNFEKLSSEACLHLAQNTKFPSRSALQALISQQTKLKNLLQDINDPRSCDSSPCSHTHNGIEGKKDETSKQIVLYAGNLDVVAENEKLRAHLQGMQWRVTQLEKACRKMQTQMTKIMRSRSSSSRNNTRSLPKLCS